VYKLGKNWQTRAWHPVFKTAGSARNVSKFWLLLHHSDGAQQNQDKNEQFNIAYDQW
jgi:hypothetical protein